MFTLRQGFFIFMAISVLSASVAGAGSTGTSGAAILKQSLSARPSGMGNCFSGIADDLNSVYYNPAGLAAIAGVEFNMSYLKGFADINFASLGYGQKIGNFVLGVNLTSLQAGTMNIYDINRKVSRVVSAQNDYLLIFSYARELGKKITLGTNIKLLHSTLVQDYFAFSCAVDLGLLYRPLTFLGIGLVMQNFGLPLRYVAKEDPLPLNFKLGLDCQVYSRQSERLNLVLDLALPDDYKTKLGIGAEYAASFLDLNLTLRLGYVYDNPGGITAGLGLREDIYQIDYAYREKEGLGVNHWITLQIKL